MIQKPQTLALVPAAEIAFIVVTCGVVAWRILPAELAIIALCAALALMGIGYCPDTPLALARETLHDTDVSEWWELPSSSGRESMFVHVRRWHLADSTATPKRNVSVVCLHGTFTSSHEFDGWARELKETSSQSILADVIEVVAVDLPGHGLTGPWEQDSGDAMMPYSIDSDIKFIEQLLESEKMHGKQIVLVGHSIGGALATTYTAHFPQRVIGIILISPWGLRYGPSDPCMQHCVWFVKFILSPRWWFLNQWLCLLLIRITPKLLVHYAIGTAFGPGPPTPKRERIKAAADTMQRFMLCAGNRRTFISRLTNFVNQERHPIQSRSTCTSQLAELRCPVQIQWGGSDTWLHVSRVDAWAIALAHCLKRSDIVIFPGVGHCVPEQAPQESAKAVWRFVKAALSQRTMSDQKD